MWLTAIMMFVFTLQRAVDAVADPCIPNPCQNGATCEPASYDAASFQCKLNCPSNCYGQQCEVCVPTSTLCSSCPAGFTESVPGSCFSTLSGNFDTTSAICANSGGTIATINNAAEDYQIRGLVMASGQSYAMTGWGDKYSTGIFSWADGSTSTYLRCSITSTGWCCLVPSLSYSESGGWLSGYCTTAYGAVCRVSCATGACASNPCQNGAICEAASYSASSYQCKWNCPSNCYGQQCEVCVPTSSLCASCPAGFTESIPGSCFKTLSGNYDTTNAICASSGGTIATINSAAEDYQIRGLVMASGQSYVMTGWGDKYSTDTFSWADGSTSTYLRCSTATTGWCCLVPSLSYSESGDWLLGPCTANYGAACRISCTNTLKEVSNMAPKHISYRLMRRRMRRTLNYGENRRMDHLSLPLTELAADYFDKHAPFDYLDMDYATNLSREGCVDPCTLIVALVYLDRVRLNDQQYFETTDPANLYLAALIVASKFLHDDGNADFVYNDEWAASASTTLKHVNEQEINMLNGLNWNLLVNAEDFGSALRSVESHLARKSLLSRGYATYSDLRVLSRHLAETNYLWQQFLQPLLTLFGLASLAYTATVFGLFGASLHLRGLSASTGMTSCDKPTLPIDLLPIAHSTISGLESLAYVSSCPENLLNVHIRAIPLENRIATPESHQKPSIEPRLLDLDEHPPLPLPSISSSAMPETITNHQRIADSWSYGLDFETYGGCLRRNLTFNQPSIMGFA